MYQGRPAKLPTSQLPRGAFHRPSWQVEGCMPTRQPADQPVPPSLLTRQGNAVGGLLWVRPFLHHCHRAAHGGGGAVRPEQHLQEGRFWMASWDQ